MRNMWIKEQGSLSRAVFVYVVGDKAGMKGKEGMCHRAGDILKHHGLYNKKKPHSTIELHVLSQHINDHMLIERKLKNSCQL